MIHLVAQKDLKVGAHDIVAARLPPPQDHCDTSYRRHPRHGTHRQLRPPSNIIPLSVSGGIYWIRHCLGP
ncbi:hypothetical protein P8452_19463 [Trifolium repens]|nr:hypothetical protein P8452_19463 [Trifolium repens]